MDIEDQVKKEMYKKYAKALDEREAWRYKVNNSLLMAGVTIFSIVISLNLLVGSQGQCLYKWAVLSNGVCLLFQILVLYMTIRFHNRVVRKFRDHILVNI